jgi:hypothetical protein
VDLGRSASQEALRRTFLHQDGLVVATALAALEATGQLTRLASPTGLSAHDVEGLGSPHVIVAALRAGTAAGWLTRSAHADGARFAFPTADRRAITRAVTSLVQVHADLAAGLSNADWSCAEDVIDRTVPVLTTLRRGRSDLEGALATDQASVFRHHLEGPLACLVLPRLVPPGRQGRAGGEPGPPSTGAQILAALEMISPGGQPTGLGRAGEFFTPMYGLAGSYARPLLAVPALLRAGHPLRPGDVTATVDRPMNVIASGAAHRGYVAAAKGIVREILDASPVAEQPQAIVDVGCGDGSLLRSLAEVVTRTRRGRALGQHPLLLVGVDLDPRALRVAEATPGTLPVTYLQGDVGEPGTLVARLADHGVDPDTALHVRAFVDHNRRLGADGDTPEPGIYEPDLSAPAYVGDDGSPWTSHLVREDWVRHYRRWAQVLGQHGMVVIEGHPLPMATTARRRGSSHSLAFEFYHSLSGQSAVGQRAFRQACRAASLVADAATERGFPAGRTPSTTVQRLRPARHAGR